MNININDINSDFIRNYVDGIKAKTVRNSGISVDAGIKDTFLKKMDRSKDGKFSLREAGKNFIKGLVSPITAIFSSVKNFAIGAGIIAAGVGLIAVTGGAAAIPLIALGVTTGVITSGVGMYNLITAKNGDDAEKSFYKFGQALFEIGGSLHGARMGLKGALFGNGGKAVKNIEIARSIGVAADKADDVVAVSNFINKMNKWQALIASIRASQAGLKASCAKFRGSSAEVAPVATKTTVKSSDSPSTPKAPAPFSEPAPITPKQKPPKPFKIVVDKPSQ